MKVSVLLLFFLFSISIQEKILFYNVATATSSHLTFPTELAKKLAKENHNVTFVLPKKFIPWVENVANLKVIEANPEEVDSMKTISTSNAQKEGGIWNFYKIAMKEFETYYKLEHENFESILHKEKPDVVLLDFMSIAAHDVLDKEGVERIVYVTAGVFPSESMKNLFLPSPMSPVKLSEMNFLQRLKNFVNKMTFKPMMIFLDRFIFTIRREYGHVDGIKFPKIPNCHQIGSGFLPWGHPDHLSPYLHFTGGSLRNEDLTMESDLENWLKDKKNVIYISFGTHALFEEKELKGILKGSLNMKDSYILISIRENMQKYSNFKLEDYSENAHRIRVETWVNQQAVLSHSSVSLFITHGGYQSILESLHFKKPVLGIGVFGDQSFNVLRIQELNLGEGMKKENIEENEITNKLQNIFSNYNTFVKNIDRMNEIRKSHGGVDKGVEIVNFVLKFGSKDFKMVSDDLNMFVRESLDVYSFVLIFTIFSIFIFWKILKCCTNCICKKQKID
jgi:UDP:flavonoid glycosyltransferase YjiC (YdhE family)